MPINRHLQRSIKIDKSHAIKSKRIYADCKRQERQARLLERERCINNALYALQQDLFKVMGGHAYSKLANIAQPSYIRIHGWRAVPAGAVVYQYELDKELYVDMPKRIPEPILAHIQRSVNLDIAQKQNEMKTVYPMEFIRANFCFLYYGMQVTCMKDMGTYVLMEVVTNVQP